MKLSLLFDKNNEETIMYDLNEIYIRAKEAYQIPSFLINKQFKLENIEYRKNNIQNIIDFELGEEKTKEEKIISFIKTSIDKSLELKDFKSFEIKIKEKVLIADYKEFLEKIDGDIVIDASNFSKENINFLKKVNFKKEPLIRHELNINLILLSEFLETVDIISTIETAIKRFSLSKLEQQMLLFDFIRARVFKEGSKNDYASSRDLNRVLKEEEIVCAGYANIFAAVSNHLNIPTFVKSYVSKNDKSRGHATNVSYFYDSYYDEQFALEFDPTWNSKKNINDKNWINNYNFFAQSERTATLLKDKMNYNVLDSLLNDIDVVYQRYLYFLEQGTIKFGVDSLIKKIITQAIELYTYLEDYNKIETLNNILINIEDEKDISPNFIDDLYLKIKNLHSKPVPLNVFLKALYRVRRIEHSIDPDVYPLDYKIIEKICSEKYRQDKLLLKILVNKKNVENMQVLNYVPAHVKNKIDYDVKMMRLLYQLRTITKNKTIKNSLTNK